MEIQEVVYYVKVIPGWNDYPGTKPFIYYDIPLLSDYEKEVGAKFYKISVDIPVLPELSLNSKVEEVK